MSSFVRGSYIFPNDGVTDHRFNADFDAKLEEFEAWKEEQLKWLFSYGAWRVEYEKWAPGFWLKEFVPPGREELPNCRLDVAKLVWSRPIPPWGRQEELAAAQRQACTPEVLEQERLLIDQIITKSRGEHVVRGLARLYSAAAEQARENELYLRDLGSLSKDCSECVSSEVHRVLVAEAIPPALSRVRALMALTSRLARALSTLSVLPATDPIAAALGAEGTKLVTAQSMAILKPLLLQYQHLEALDQYLGRLDYSCGYDPASRKPSGLQTALPIQRTSPWPFTVFTVSRTDARMRSAHDNYIPSVHLISTVASVFAQPGETHLFAVRAVDFKVRHSAGGSMLVDYVRSANLAYDQLKSTFSQQYPYNREKIGRDFDECQRINFEGFRVPTAQLVTAGEALRPVVEQTLSRVEALSVATSHHSLAGFAGLAEMKERASSADFTPVSGPLGEEWRDLSREIRDAVPTNEAQRVGAESARVALLAASVAYLDGEVGKGRAYAHIARVMARLIHAGARWEEQNKELLIGLSPAGWVLDTYQALTGRNLDGFALSDVDRGFAVFCMAAGGPFGKVGVKAVEGLGRIFQKSVEGLARLSRATGIAEKLEALLGPAARLVRGGRYVRKLDPANLPPDYRAAFLGHIFTGEYRPGELLFQAQRKGQSEAGRWFTTYKPISAKHAEEMLDIQRFGNDAERVVVYRVKAPVSGYAGKVAGDASHPATGHQFLVPRDVPLKDVVEEVGSFRRNPASGVYDFESRPGRPMPSISKDGAKQPTTASPHAATSISGREYSEHALDRMQQRGIPPTVVEHTIQKGKATPGRSTGTTVYHDAANNVTVVVDSETGRVITTRRGGE